MITPLVCKIRQLLTDPVLRKWLYHRLAGAAVTPPPFTPHRPPYLSGPAADAGEPRPPKPLPPLAAMPPAQPITLPLPGLALTLAPGEGGGLFRRRFADVETLLALHRFAWLPLVANGEAKKSWAQALWSEWRQSFAGDGAEQNPGWAWHPYTAAERACNLLDLAATAGLPEPVADTVRLLDRHIGAIFERLEYFGDHDTSNHLANDGRGIFRVALALGRSGWADIGTRILIEEAARILLPSGVLREGSSHYHLLIARNYADAWLAARAYGHPAEPALKDIAARALAVAPHLALPGGLPLIGDVSPDCPPEFLAGLAGGGDDTGWIARLAGDQRAALAALTNGTPAPQGLDRDGWLKVCRGPWAGLWHAAPRGWPSMPGHAHQDLGSFEVHLGALPVVVDPGRGAYGEYGEAARYRSGLVHNTLLVDDRDPYPANKPYYDDAFRGRIVDRPPALAVAGREVTLVHHGFRRLRSVGALTRRWTLGDRGVTIDDRLEGRGRRRISRRFATPLAAEALPGGVLLKGGGRTLWLSAGPAAEVTARPITLWRAYGDGRPGVLVELTERADLPWSGRATLEVS